MPRDYQESVKLVSSGDVLCPGCTICMKRVAGAQDETIERGFGFSRYLTLDTD